MVNPLPINQAGKMDSSGGNAVNNQDDNDNRYNDNRLTDAVKSEIISDLKQSASLATQDLQSNSNEIRLTDNVGDREKQPVSLEKPEKTETNNDNRLTDNVVKGKNEVKTTYCEYELCGKEFVQTVSWKRHCCDDCRIKNWELKHGKTFKKKMKL